MVPDRQKVWMDGQTDGMDGRRQNYITQTLSEDKKIPKMGTFSVFVTIFFVKCCNKI